MIRLINVVLSAAQARPSDFFDSYSIELDGVGAQVLAAAGCLTPLQ